MDFTITPTTLTQEQRIAFWEAGFQPGDHTGFDVYYNGLKKDNICALSAKEQWWAESIVTHTESDIAQKWLDHHYSEREQDIKNLSQYLTLTMNKEQVERSDYLTCLWKERGEALYLMAKYKYGNDLLKEKYIDPPIEPRVREIFIAEWLTPGFFGKLPDPLMNFYDDVIENEIREFPWWLEKKHGTMAAAVDDLLGLLVRACRGDLDSTGERTNDDEPNDDGGPSNASVEIEL